MKFSTELKKYSGELTRGPLYTLVVNKAQPIFTITLQIVHLGEVTFLAVE